MRDDETVLGIIQVRGKRGLTAEEKGGFSTCTSELWSAGGGRPWCSAGNVTRTFMLDAWTNAAIEVVSDWKAG